MSHGLIILLILAVFLFLGLGWCLVRFGTIGEADLDEPQGYVDQDGERTPTSSAWIETGRFDPDAWKNLNGIKTPHADASAATFHRAE